MALTTFSELKTSVANWLHRTDLTSVIPDFVTLAESGFATGMPSIGVDPLRAERMVTITALTIDAEFEAVPSDFAGPVGLTLTDSQGNIMPLENITPDSMDVMRATRDSQQGQPVAYCLYNRELRFSPVPDQSYSATLTYWKAIPALSDSNTSNWVLANYPNVYLFGTLLQAAPYLDDDTRIPTWQSRYSEALAGLAVAERLNRGSRNTPGFRAADIRNVRRQYFNINTGL